MAKDYFQDITPPAGGANPPRQFNPPQPVESNEESESETDARDIPIRIAGAPASNESAVDTASRGIRNIPTSHSRSLRPLANLNRADQGIREITPPLGGVPQRPRSSGRLWVWAIASVAILLIGGGILFFFGSTKVTVTPKSRTVALASTTLTAHEVTNPESATQGSLSYTLQTFDLEDSEVVEAKGTTHVESKASGSITVYNSFSTSPVKLLKATRFQTPDGLIFRAPAEVMVPGKKGATPGQVNITVIADQAGEKYNIGPVSKFTLPGLKSTAPMYAGVYAKSSAGMTGGASGEQADTAPGVLEAARAQVRSRLSEKTRSAALGQAKDGSLVFPDIISITYESLLSTSEAGGSLRIHEKAHVEVPLFPADAFAQAVAESALTDADGAEVSLKPSNDFALRTVSENTEGQPGILNLALTGSALVVWKVDSLALAEALKGKDSSAFQGIISGFASIEEAHARVAPFWKNTFPAEASDITIDILEPVAAE